MQARAVLLFLAVLGCLTVSHAELTPPQIVDYINILTSKSQDLQAPANGITIINGPLIIVGRGPFASIIAGYTDIITRSTEFLTRLQGTPTISNPDDATAVADAFKAFSREHQALLNILIDKAGLFTTVPYIGQPVSQVLRSAEPVIDTVAIALLDTLESSASDTVEPDAAALFKSLERAIEAYDNLSNSVNTAASRKMLRGQAVAAA